MKDLGIVVKLILVEKKDVLYSILFGFLAGISAVGLFSSSGYLISKAALIPPLYALTVMIALLKLFGLARAGSRYAERYFSHRATFTMLSNLRVTFFDKLEPLAPGIFQKYRSGDLLARIVGDVESLQNFFLRVYYPPIVLAIVFLSTVVFTSFFSIYIALLLVLGLILTAFVVPAWFAFRQRKINYNVREVRGELSTEVTELLYGFRDLKIYQKLEDKERMLTKSSMAYIQEQEKDGVQSMVNQSINLMVSLMISWFVLALGAFLVVEGQLDGLFLAMLVMISLTVFENATPMALLPGHLEESRRASNRLFSVVREEPLKIEEPIQSLPEDQALLVEMNNVTFSFEGETRKTIDQVSLRLPAGSKTAIVGPSGSGKSTLMQLLLKIQKVDSGEIRLAGSSISQINQEDIWNNANVVLQENHFFYGTIRENLMIACDGLSDEELVTVLAKVQLSHIGLDDEVFEKGENLSGGEKQRLAIARVLLRGQRLWLLDEPTSSVDALTESSIYHHLFEQSIDDTLVLISHRLTGLEQMDQIIVMENGRIVEAGTFDELMKKQGQFYEMKEIEKTVLM